MKEVKRYVPYKSVEAYQIKDKPALIFFPWDKDGVEIPVGYYIAVNKNQEAMFAVPENIFESLFVSADEEGYERFLSFPPQINSF